MKEISNNLIFILFLTFSAASAQNLNLKKYDNYLKTLNLTKHYSTSIAANKYKELFISENLSVKDSAFVLFEIFYDSIENKMNELHWDDKTDYSVLFYNTNNVDKIQIPDIVLNYRNDLIDNGFDIAMGVGLTYIKQDRYFISKNFYKLISPTMKDYCTFLNLVIREGTLNDAAFVISPTRLAERIIWLENFIYSNTQFLLINDSISYYKCFLYLLLNGSNNSSILDDNDMINQNFIDAYNYVILEYPQSKTAKLVSPLYQFLKNKQKEKAYELIEKYTKENIIEY